MTTTEATKDERHPQAHAETPDFRSAVGPASSLERIKLLQRAVGNQAVGTLLRSHLEPNDRDGERHQDGSQVERHESEGPQPLDDSTRGWMERAFDHNFGDVRVHTDDSAARSARAHNAAAYTIDRNVVFDAGRYDPASTEGKALIAHELAHVVQQSRHSISSTNPNRSLEAEAAGAAHSALSGGRVAINRSAPAGTVQCQSAGTSATAKPNWKSGDIVLNNDARADVMERGALFSGGDQAHVNVSNRGRLAYDQDHTMPEDPFRWLRFKEIVDTGHARISAVNSSTKFNIREVVGGKTNKVPRSLDEIKILVKDLSVTGITLVREKAHRAIRAKEIAARAPAPGKAPAGSAGSGTAPAAAPAAPPAPPLETFSDDDAHDQIFYDVSERSALAHEFFGHLWLAARGVPFLHPAVASEEALMGTLSARHGITDPFGRTFTGTVRSYISQFIEARSAETRNVQKPGQKQPTQVTVPRSPTEQVSKQQFADAVIAFGAAAGKGGLGKQGNKLQFSAEVAQQWRLMSDNYALLDKAAQKSVSTALAADFRMWTKDQQDAFRILLQDTQARKGFSGDALANDTEKLVGTAANPSMFQQTPALELSK